MGTQKVYKYGVLSLLALCCQAGAQQIELEEIVVTAQKRTQNLQDVPIAVTAITAKDLKNRGAFETSDLNQSMPNLQVSSPYGQQQPNFSIRGVGVGTEYNANAASPVGVYVDEVYQTFRASHGQQLYDLEQIEVIRGSQGTLFGRNTTGGAIDFSTVKPNLEGSRGYVTLGYGDYDRVAVEGAVEFTPVKDVLGFRIAANYVESDPFVENLLAAGTNTSAAFGASGLNLNTGRDPGGFESEGVRASMHYVPNERTEINIKAYHGRTEGGTETPLPTGQSTQNDVIDFLNPNGLLSGLFAQLAPAGLLPSSYSADARGLNDLQIEADTIGEALTEAQGVVLNVQYALNDAWSLTSISGYDQGEYLQTQTDCDSTPLRFCSIGYGSEFDAFNQDLRLAYESEKVTAIIGAYYGEDQIISNNRPDFFNFMSDIRAAVGLPADYFNPGGFFSGAGLSATSLPTGIRGTNNSTQERESIALYSEGSYQVSDAIKVTAGLRFTSDDISFSDGVTTFFDDNGTARLITVSDFQQGGQFSPYFLEAVRDEAGNVVIPSFQDLGIPLPDGLAREDSSDELTGRVIVDWKPSEETLVYASFNHGYRAGTYNGLGYGTANQIYFVQPETVDSFEIGFKSRFLDNRLQLNGALFYYDYEGQQGQVVDATATANLISFDGEVQGLELEALYALSERLTFSAALGLLSTEYDEQDCPSAPITAFPAQEGNCVVSARGAVSVGGNSFAFAPESTVNLGFDWDVMQSADAGLYLHVDMNYSGDYNFDSFENYTRGPLQQISTGEFAQGEGDYWIGNARLTYESGNYSVAAFVKNFTDETYFPYGISLENLFGNGYRVRAAPRTWGIEASLRF